MTPSIDGVYTVSSIEGFIMRPVSRGKVNKGRSARKFRRNVGKTKAANNAVMPMRGGWRL